MNISRELSHIVLFKYCSHSDSRPLKQWKIWIMFKNLTFHHYSRHFWGPLFGFRKRYNHENNENIWWKALIFIIFHRVPQIITFCGRYVTSKTVKIMKIWLKNSFFIIFHKLRQTGTFWGRYLTSENVTSMKIIKICSKLFTGYFRLSLFGVVIWLQKV